jgi:hypothetical protein
MKDEQWSVQRDVVSFIVKHCHTIHRSSLIVYRFKLMVVSNFIFDIVVFGALFLAALADGALPQTFGAATLFAVGAAIYIGAQEWCDTLLRRRQWTQDALSTAVALSTLGFIYFWWRNPGDFALLILSIGLMMASLMLAIAVIAAFGVAIKERSAQPLAGLVLTIIGAFALGVLGGVLVLFLGGGASLLSKAIVIGLSVFAWKIRETVRPPHANVHADGKAPAAPTDFDLNLPSTHAARWALIPRGGTLLDRLAPVLVLSTILFLAARQMKSPDLWNPTPPVSADPNAPFVNGDYGDDNAAP